MPIAQVRKLRSRIDLDKEQVKDLKSGMFIPRSSTFIYMLSKIEWRSSENKTVFLFHFPFHSLPSPSLENYWFLTQLYYDALHACSVAQSCPNLCNPVDCSPRGSSVHGIFQARIVEWVAISSSRGSSWPRDQTHGTCVSCIGRCLLYH